MSRSKSQSGAELQAPEDGWVKTKAPETVRGMFASISPTYDALNHALSLNIDKLWRRTLSRQTLSQAKPKDILDVCGGTGDLSISISSEAARMGLSPRIICSDFTPEMISIASKKFGVAGSGIIPVVADTTPVTISR